MKAWHIYLVIGLVVFLDWITDGKIDGFGTHTPYFLIPLQWKASVLAGWIRVKKKDGTRVKINLSEVEQIDMRATLKQVKRKEHHHKHES